MKNTDCVIPGSLPQAHRTTLHDLPPEVLSEVASHLDFVDILSLQRTSKKMRESTEAHVVWLRLAKTYSARHFHLYRPETGTLDDLKTDELRAWIRKRLVIDQIWRAHSAQPRFRTLSEDRDIVFKLVPGGRWLLVGHKIGTVRYYDLDSNNPRWAPLVPPFTDARGFSRGGIHGLRVYVDQDVPRLEFKLVVHGSENSPIDEVARGQLDVWQVKLEGSGSLAAERLSSIPYSHTYPMTFTLGRHLIACQMFAMSGPSWIAVYWWEQCSGTRVLRSYFFAGYEVIEKMCLIGDDRILCINQNGEVRLYDFLEPGYSDIEELIPQSTTNPIRQPIWSHSLSGRPYIFSSPVYYDGTTYRLVVSTNKGIWGLVLPAAKDDNPSTTLLSGFSNVCVPGIRKAYALCGEEGTGVRIGYSWNDGDGTSVVEYINGELRDAMLFIRYAEFDEEVGRFVYRNGGGFVVVDFLH